MNQNMILVLAAAAAAYFFLSKKGKPAFLLPDGQEVSQVPCGTPIIFDVPGYSNVWLFQLQDGRIQYDGPYAVPSPAYAPSCTNDTGHFQAAVYELNPDGTKGAEIGFTELRVSA